MQKNLVTFNNGLKGYQRCLDLAGKSAVRRPLCWVLVDSEGEHAVIPREKSVVRNGKCTWELFARAPKSLSQRQAYDIIH